jgi:phenylacetate-CoA ligase
MLGLSDRVKTAVFLQKFALIKRQAMPYFRQIQCNQHLSSDELEHLNWQKRKQLLAHAYENVAYYHQRFVEAGIDPENLKRPEDYNHVPLLTRDDLRNNFDRLISRGAKRRHMLLSTTGGSTGQPVKVYHDGRFCMAPLGWRMMDWWGVTPGMNCASVWRGIRPGLLRDTVRAVVTWPTSELRLDAACLGEEEIRKFIWRFKTHRPRFLRGYVGAVDYLASFILDNAISVAPLAAVWVTSSPFTAVQEKRIEAAFGAPIYDQYGCCEVHWLAAQCCVRGLLHSFHDARLIEFVDDQGRGCPVGNVGRVAITDLENYVFPIIRYINGDEGRGMPGRCACGVNLPLIDKIHGRVNDTIVLPSGRRISSNFVDAIFDGFPEAVKQFQVHQEEDYSLRLIVVPNVQFGACEASIASAVRALSAAARGEVCVAVEKVKEIPHNRGKLSFITSKIKPASARVPPRSQS